MHIRNEDKSKTHNLSFHGRKPENEEQFKPKGSRRKKVTKLKQKSMKFKTEKQ